ncbi:hypothetical protein E4U41_002984, partial [Claviceps citrina]
PSRPPIRRHRPLRRRLRRRLLRLPLLRGLLPRHVPLPLQEGPPGRRRGPPLPRAGAAARGQPAGAADVAGLSGPGPELGGVLCGAGYLL